MVNGRRMVELMDDFAQLPAGTKLAILGNTLQAGGLGIGWLG